MTAAAQYLSLLMLLLIAGRAVAQPPPEDQDAELVATSSGTHLWFVLPSRGESSRVDLCHHAFAAAGPYGRAVQTLPRAPEALAAWGSRLWLIFPCTETGRVDRREIYRLQIIRDPVTGAYLPRPADRLDAVAPIPSGGKLIDFVAGPAGPLVLLSDGAISPDRRVKTEPSDHGVGLLRLQQNEWKQIELPPDIKLDEQCHIALAGEESEHLYLLAENAREDRRPVLWTRGADHRWESAAIDIDPAGWAWHDLIRVDTQIAGVLVSRDRRARVGYLRPRQLIDLVTFDHPDVPWQLLGSRGGMRLLSVVTPSDQAARPRPLLRRINPITGEVSEAERLVPQPVDVMARLRLPILLAIVIIAGGMVLLLRPLPRLEARAIAGWEVAGAGTRLAGLLLDVLPAGLLAMLILRVAARDLLVLPLMTSDPADWIPYVTMALITMGHSTISELATRKTLGKVFLNGLVMSVDGSKPSVPQITRRNVVKTLVLLVPPLMIVVLLTPNRQGLQDLAGSTLVVRRRDEEQ